MSGRTAGSRLPNGICRTVTLPALGYGDTARMLCKDGVPQIKLPNRPASGRIAGAFLRRHPRCGSLDAAATSLAALLYRRSISSIEMAMRLGTSISARSPSRPRP